MNFRHIKKWKVRLFCSLAVLILLGWVFVGSILPSHSGSPVDGVSLQLSKKLFEASESPVLTLHFHHATEKSGFLERLTEPNVYAAAMPQVEVDYNGRKADVETTVRPQGKDFLLTITSKQQLKPGTYTVKANGELTGNRVYEKTTTFAWGVLGVNTDKSIYSPGETAHLQMGAVDTTGHTICKAPLQLHIADPRGDVKAVAVQQTGSCKGDSYSATPDYVAAYKVTDVGRYKITLGVANTAYSVTDYFEVRQHTPFSITRDSVTRMYPINAYGMHLHVKAGQNFSGKVTEVISDSRFKILQHDANAKVIRGDGQIKIQWQVDWKAGHAYDLRYQFFPPPISPAFYTVGPLQLANSVGHTIFKEARSWQLLGDAAITLVKETEHDAPASLSDTLNVTSTAGNTLVLLFMEAAAGTSNGLASITDSASNSWVYSNTTPNQNPPANYAGGTASEIAIGYVTNASAISSITVGIQGSTATVFSYDLLEFSNIDATNPVDQSASDSTSTTSTSHTTPTITATTCDSPTTDMLLRGGDYFCTSVNELVIGMASSGFNDFTRTTSGFTDTQPLHTQGFNGDAYGAYKITSASGAYSINWTSTKSKKDSTAIMSFRQNGNTSGGDEQSFFWAK